MSDQTLDELGRKHDTDKAREENAYTRLYPKYLERYREAPLRLLEVGVFRGASCRMWDEYFSHSDARLYAIDNKSKHLRNLPDSPRWQGFLGDQADRGFLESVCKETEAFDVVIDDGTHIPDHQILTFETLWPHVKPGGVYAIEDINTSHSEAFFKRRIEGTGGRRSIMPYLHGLLDEVVPAAQPSATELAFVHFYPHLVLIGRR